MYVCVFFPPSLFPSLFLFNRRTPTRDWRRRFFQTPRPSARARVHFCALCPRTVPTRFPRLFVRTGKNVFFFLLLLFFLFSPSHPPTLTTPHGAVAAAAPLSFATSDVVAARCTFFLGQDRFFFSVLVLFFSLSTVRSCLAPFAPAHTHSEANPIHTPPWIKSFKRGAFLLGGRWWGRAEKEGVFAFSFPSPTCPLPSRRQRPLSCNPAGALVADAASRRPPRAGAMKLV